MMKLRKLGVVATATGIFGGALAFPAAAQTTLTFSSWVHPRTT